MSKKAKSNKKNFLSLEQANNLLLTISMEEWATTPLNVIGEKYNIEYWRVFQYAKKHGIQSPSGVKRMFDYSVVTDEDINTLTMAQTAKKYGIPIKPFGAWALRNKIKFPADNIRKGFLAKLDQLNADDWSNSTAADIAERVGCPLTMVFGYANRHNIKYKKQSKGGRPHKNSDRQKQLQEQESLLDSLSSSEWESHSVGEISKKYGFSYTFVSRYVQRNNIKVANKQGRLRRYDYSAISDEDMKTLTLSQTAKKYAIPLVCLSAYAKRHNMTFLPATKQRKA